MSKKIHSRRNLNRKKSTTRRNLNRKKPTKIHRQFGGNIVDEIKTHMELLTELIDDKSLTAEAAAPVFREWVIELGRLYTNIPPRKALSPGEIPSKEELLENGMKHWIYTLYNDYGANLNMNKLLFYKKKIENIIDNLERLNVGIEIIPNTGVLDNNNHLKAKPNIVEHVNDVRVITKRNAFRMKPDGKELRSLINKLLHDLKYRFFSSPSIPEDTIRRLQSQLQSSRDFMDMDDETLLTFMKRDPTSVTPKDLQFFLDYIKPILQAKIEAISNAAMMNFEPIPRGRITRGPIVNNNK